ncbi:MAG: TolC family protein [Bacteroidetes bacterium]|nr:TolC family protein [Bacteroidota bacterium]
MKIRLAAAVLITFTFAAGLYAQNNQKVYSLQDAISTAQQNNSSLVNAKLDRLKAERKVSQVYNENLLPTLDLSSQYIRAFKKQYFDIFGQRYSIGTDNQVINTLNVQEPIPVLGTPVFQGIRIAEYYSNLQNENVASEEARVVGEVKKAFYNVLFLREVFNVRKQALDNSLDNFDVVEKKFRNGTATEFDFLRAKVTAENNRPPLLEAENNLIIGKKSLKNSIGLKDNSDIEVSGSLDFDSLEIFGDKDILINKIANNHVSVRQLQISRNINSELLGVDKANYLPKFYVFGQFNLQAAEDDGRTVDNYRYFPVVNAGVGMSWNLNFFRNTYKKQQTEIEIKKTDETISDVKQKLKISAQTVLLKIEEAKKKIIASMETVRLAERGYELAALSFKNGVINQIDVIDSQLMLSNSKLGYYQAILEYQLAKAGLEELLEKNK